MSRQKLDVNGEEARMPRRRCGVEERSHLSSFSFIRMSLSAAVRMLSNEKTYTWLYFSRVSLIVFTSASFPALPLFFVCEDPNTFPVNFGSRSDSEDSRGKCPG
eukprot:175657-Rhodomonas_salina.1